MFDLKVKKTLEAIRDLIQRVPFEWMRSRIRRYGAILSSIKQDGMIEPIMIYPQKGKSGSFLILDGHLRHLALKELGETKADSCSFKEPTKASINRTGFSGVM